MSQKRVSVVIDGISCLIIPFASLDDFWQEAHDDEFAFGCKCGESYRDAFSASRCRKCSVYLSYEDNDGTVYYTPSTKKNREAREEQEATDIQARYEEEVLNV